MIKIIVSLRDNVAEVFNDPRAEINVASAIRAFTETLKDHPHKNDFTLYELGAYDTDSGELLPHTPIKLMSGVEIKVHTGITEEMQIADLETFKKQSGAA